MDPVQNDQAPATQAQPPLTPKGLHPSDQASKAVDDTERAEFLAAMEKDFEVEPTDRGSMITGTILSISADYAFIDLGGKSEGILAVDEIREEDGSLPAVGSQVEACILSQGADGMVLSKKLAKGIRSREFLGEAYKNKIPVEGRVSSRNKGGFEVEVAGVRGFCPIGQIELRFCDDPDSHLGKRYTFRITKYETNGRRLDLVLSRKAILEVDAKKRAEELRKTLKVGDIISGTVRSLHDFGAFVDLGGLDGMLPVSELSHSRVGHPRDVLTSGEELHTQVIAIEKGGDRITLSLKRLEPDPWDDIQSLFPIGTRILGKVVKLMPFGAFVEIAEGIEGLIHISNFNTPDRISHPSVVVKEDTQVQVEVLSVDTVQKRIALARVPSDGEFGSIPVVGAVLEGKVEKVMPFGIFVVLGPGRKGLIPNSETGTPKGSDATKAFPAGARVKVLVQDVTDNGRKIRLSVKAAQEAEERADFEGFIEKDGSSAAAKAPSFGTFADLLKSKTQPK